MVDAFVAAKDARWPEHAEQIAPRMTLEALAQQHLDAGGTVELLTEVIQRAVRDWKNPTPPTSLAALKNSLADRVAQHRRALDGGGSRASSGSAGDPHEVDPHDQSRQRLRHWVRTGWWEPRWGEIPGHRSCLIPDRVILEVIPDFKPGWRPPAAAGNAGSAACPPLFSAEAEAALQIFRALKIVDVPGSPTFEEACRGWVFDFVGAVFGAYDAETGRRLINEFLLLISKKNSKSTIAAGIMVTALLRNWRQNAEFIIVAPTIKVAQNSADPAMSMVSADPELFEILKPVPHLRMIEHRTTGATLKILAADSDVVTGNKATGVLIDELHLFGTKANAEAMLREARGGLTSRPEGFVIALSTQGEEPPAGVFKQWLARFRDIRDGKIAAPKSLGVLYEFPKAMLEAKAHLRPENFHVTNPNMGASVDEEFLLDEYTKAQLGGESSVRGFLSKHLNVEVGLNMGSDRWAGADFWEVCGEQGLTLEAILARCEVVVVGIDGGGLDDLLGLAVLGRCRETRRWLMWHRAWASRARRPGTAGARCGRSAT